MKKLKKVSELQLFLSVLFVTSLLISNIITAKQVLLPFGITMTGAVFIFPVNSHTSCKLNTFNSNILL